MRIPTRAAQGKVPQEVEQKTREGVVAGEDPLAFHGSSPGELQARLAAERRGLPFLVYRSADGAQHLYTLDESKPTVTVGRTDATDVALHWDGEVSRVHCQFEFIGGEWTVLDDGLSRNGTYVNGDRVARHRLEDGDRVQVGQTVLVFSGSGLGDSKSTVARQDGSSSELSAAQRRVLIALCRPFKEMSPYATPTTNQEIADELFVSVDAVKTQLRSLFRRFDIEDLPQNQKRARLVELALKTGLISPREL